MEKKRKIYDAEDKRGSDTGETEAALHKNRVLLHF